MVTATTRKAQPNPSSSSQPAKRSKALAAAEEGGKVKRKRTKAGCITCRVRGKKCDETRHPDNTCGTCKRLRIHCLGFNDRRPEWLRSKENIKEWRKRVTDFLLSQGLVKGHAGCGLRPLSTPERSLSLDEMRANLSGGEVDELDSDGPLSAPLYPRSSHQTGFHLPHEPIHFPLNPVSTANFGSGNWQDRVPGSNESSSSFSPPSAGFAHPLPEFPDQLSNEASGLIGDIPVPSFSQNFTPPNSYTLSPFSPSPLLLSTYGPYVASPALSSSDQAKSLTSTGASSGSSNALIRYDMTGNVIINGREITEEVLNALLGSVPNVIPQFYVTPGPSPKEVQDFYVKRYFDHVLGIQYRLADQATLPYLMSSLAQSSPAVKSSIYLLSVLHTQAQALVNGVLSARARANGNKQPIAIADVPAAPMKDAQALYNELYAQTQQLLSEAKYNKPKIEEGDAMACLHVVSAFLFSGGRGTWDEFLSMAGDWVEASIREYGNSALSALLSMSPMGRFIFRTTMWMDIFSGVSICRPPRFLNYYQKLFSPEMKAAFANFQGGSFPVVDNAFGGWNMGLNDDMGDTGMDRVMGCPNEVILAFAEIASLEAWKASEEDDPLVGLTKTRAEELELQVRTRGRQIESLIPEGPAIQPWDRFIEVGNEDNDSVVDEYRRAKVAEVFRHAARVYLHSVIEGCDPQVPVIRSAVESSIRSLRALKSSPLDRALIFPLTITGCMALSKSEVDFCIGRLASVGTDAEYFGNCLQARELITAVWAKRTLSGLDSKGVPVISRSVSWRIVMRELGEDPLLLV